jgi:hypothetical protein
LNEFEVFVQSRVSTSKRERERERERKRERERDKFETSSNYLTAF